MKSLFALIIILSGLHVQAQYKKDRTTKIYCYESDPAPEQERLYFAEILQEKGRAADWIVVGTADSNNPEKKQIDVDKLIEKESGSIETGEVTHHIASIAEQGHLNYLAIRYPWQDEKLNILPAVYMGYKDAKYFKVPLLCSYLN